MNSIPTEVETHWTRQLYREFEETIWYHKVSMRPPVIQIADLGNRWGLWDPFFRTITLARRLFTEHSWDVVLEILKHEMAHQYVAEVLNVPHDNTHGEAFKIACERLGVAPWAAKSAGEIPRVIPTLRERVLHPDDEKLLIRAEKLLALAQSGNEHEALLAMQRVQELYAKHGIERLRSNRAGSMDSLVIARGRKRMEPHEAMIYSLLNKHFFVKVVHTHLYDAKKLERFKAAELLGTRENLLMAEYVFYFLLRQCEALWLNHKKAHRASGRLKRSYQLGILHGFSEKLESHKAQAKVSREMGLSRDEEKSLIVTKSEELRDYVRLRFPRIATTSRSSARVDGSTFASGKSAGQNITLQKPISGGRPGFGGYLSQS